MKFVADQKAKPNNHNRFKNRSLYYRKSIRRIDLVNYDFIFSRM